MNNRIVANWRYLFVNIQILKWNLFMNHQLSLENINMKKIYQNRKINEG